MTQAPSHTTEKLSKASEDGEGDLYLKDLPQLCEIQCELSPARNPLWSWSCLEVTAGLQTTESISLKEIVA